MTITHLSHPRCWSNGTPTVRTSEAFHTRRLIASPLRKKCNVEHKGLGRRRDLQFARPAWRSRAHLGGVRTPRASSSAAMAASVVLPMCWISAFTVRVVALTLVAWSDFTALAHASFSTLPTVPRFPIAALVEGEASKERERGECCLEPIPKATSSGLPLTRQWPRRFQTEAEAGTWGGRPTQSL
jgi:hypothetical protein